MCRKPIMYYQVEDKPIIFLPATVSEEELANAIFCKKLNSNLSFAKVRNDRSYRQGKGNDRDIEEENINVLFNTLNDAMKELAEE